ncbi:phage tail tube protein [Salinarimonas sp. NSM]|uniref:phage tail tube protein n=1 Tax=Salinarimonas sp. NSM TaxID=3458003 RepID=UPI0040360C1A
MAFAQGSRHDIAYVAESVFGTTPETPSMKALRYTSTTLNLTKEAFVSEEIRSDRQIEISRHGNRQGAGEIGFELSYGALDDLLASAMFADWSSNVISPGTTLKPFTIERRHLDIGRYLRFTGCIVNTLSLSITPNAMVTGSLGIVAKDVAPATTALGSPTAAPANEPFSSFEGTLTEGGSPIAIVTGLELQLANGVEPNFVIGSPTTPQMSFGRANLTGTLTAFFENTTLYEKFVNETISSLAVTLEDPAGNTLAIEIPRLKYNGAEVPVSGEGSILMEMPFQALRDSSEGTNLIFTRTPAA